MKTQKNTFLTIAKIALLAFTTSLMVSCGQDNTVSSSGGVSTSPGTINPAAFNQQCSAGKMPPMYYSTTSSNAGYNSKTTLFGPFQNSKMGGSIARTYVGRSTFGDLLIVEKLTNGAQVIGFNVTLSMCISDPIITAQRTLTNFQTSGITLDDDINATYGQVDSAFTIMQAPQFQYYPAFQVETFFTK